MTNSSQHPHLPSPSSRRLWLIILSRGGLALGGLLLIATIIAIWQLWTFVHQDLAPLAAQNLTTRLRRPVKLGKVTGFSFTGVRFAATAIPPTPTDPDRVMIKAVEANFDPWQLILQREIKLDVTLVNPDIYLEEDSKGRWLRTTIAPPAKSIFIKTDLDILRFRNGKVLLQPQTGQKSQVAFAQFNGSAQLLNNNKLIRLDITTNPKTGGNLAIQGGIRTSQALDGNLHIQTQGLLAADVTRLIKLPLTLPKGRVDGDLQVQLIPRQQSLIDGDASLQRVTVQIPRVPQLLSNTQGNIHFHGLALQVDKITTNYGQIPVVATGIIDRLAGFKLAAQVKQVSIPLAQKTLKVKLPVPVTGKANADIHIAGTLAKPVLFGTVTTLKNARIDKIAIESASSKFEFSTGNALIKLQDIQARPQVGGEVIGGGTIHLGHIPQLDFNFTAKHLPGEPIAQLYHFQPLLPIGSVSATTHLSGPANRVQTLVQWQATGAAYPATGELAIAPDYSISFRNVIVNVGEGVVRIAGNYTHQHWQAIAQAVGVPLTPLVPKNQLQSVSLGGAQFNGQLFLSGDTAPFQVVTLRTVGAAVAVAGGRVDISNVQLRNQNFSALLIANGVHLGQVLHQSPPILRNPLAGSFQIAGNLHNLSLKTLRGSGQGHLNLEGGRVTASNIQLGSGRYQAQIQADHIPLQQLAAVPSQLRGNLTGQLEVAGPVDALNLRSIQARGQGQLKLPEGTITASHIQVAAGHFQTLVATSDIPLNHFNHQLQGQLGGKLQVAGSVEATKLADIQAAGNVQLSPGNLKAAIAWNGQKLTLEQVTSPNLQASGYILANAQTVGIPKITQLNLRVQAQNYNLEQLPIKLPSTLGIAGKVDFTGLVAGNLPLPKITGRLGLRDLVVRGLAFEPILTGNIALVPGSGSNIDLAGQHDHLALNLDAQNHPQSFLLQWQQALATGQARGENWAIKVANFPLQSLDFHLPKTPLGNGGLAGVLTADLQVNQKTYAAQGNLAITKPQIGRIAGNHFSTQFRYADNQATLSNSEFIKGNSHYTFGATVSQVTTGPRLQATVNIAQGNIQDVLTAAQIFQIQDLQRGLAIPTYGTAANLITQPQGLPHQSLLTQLRRFYEIDALLKAQREERIQSNPIPNLADLNGIFNGEVSLDTATANGLAVEFKLNGQDFTWGRKTEPSRFYHADQIIAQGSYTKGVLQLQPLRIESPHRLIAFTGDIGGQEEFGQLRVNNFPVRVLDNFVKLPVAITGNLNATAALAGSVANPEAQGELQITDGTLNKKPLKSAIASFSYANARLVFSSKVLVEGPEPVNIVGNIPYKLPFASVKPDNNQISLDVNVKNQGLALLNLLTDQIAFEDGQGEVNISVRGSMKQPSVKGIAAINNATFTAQALPGKLTDVTGNANFNYDRVVVEKLQGHFSKGQVEVAGEIPIFNNSEETKIKDPLTVTLNQLVLKLKGLYQGGASGNLQITGSAFNPVIGGSIELSKGQVLIPQPEVSSGPSIPTLTGKEQDHADAENRITALKNLKLKLGKQVTVALPPAINFLAIGDLSVNGSLSDPVPEGEIQLIGGSINLFTTKFNLTPKRKQTVTFKTNPPRDPYLDVHLFAKVLDAVQNDNLSLPTTSLGSLESIRVEANVTGLASQIDENLELRSNPPRDETEIVTLLGGGFVDTEGRGDGTLGIINIAGSAVFNNFQGAFSQIGNDLGLTELRVFPTIISDKPDANKTNYTSSLQLALEAGVDVSPRISFSTIKILTANDPFEWGINYRIRSGLRFRASTNLTDDSRAEFEFEKRF